MGWISTSDVETAAIQELTALPPRAAAIVAAALMQDRVANLVKDQLRDGNTKDGLFKENGRLSDFDIQSKLAYTLRVISKDAYRDCQLVGRIRNAFAHNLSVTGFDHPLVAEYCRDLSLVDKHLFDDPGDDANGVSPRFFVQNLTEELAINRSRYQLTAMIITGALTIAYADDLSRTPPRERI